MARAGRKSKSGKREPNGQLSRKQKERGVVVFDRGSDWTRDKHSVYGKDGSDAIGRAFVMGLLGEHGESLRDVARALHRAYWPMLCVGPITSTLGTRSAGSGLGDNIDPAREDRQMNREAHLLANLTTVDRMGADVRRSFNQLCIDINPDEGPPWLDILIATKQRGADPAKQIGSYGRLQAALDALRAIAGPQQQGTGIQGANDGESSIDLWLQNGAA